MHKHPKFAAKLLSVAMAWYKTARHDMGDELNALANSAQAMTCAPDLPKVVILCGSTRFKQEFIDANERETLNGSIVLSVGCFERATPEQRARGEFASLTAEQKLMLDVLHKRKIDLADEVLVLNVGGYIGDSTRSEVEYAFASGKPVRWLDGALVPSPWNLETLVSDGSPCRVAYLDRYRKVRAVVEYAAWETAYNEMSEASQNGTVVVELRMDDVERRAVHIQNYGLGSKAGQPMRQGHEEHCNLLHPATINTADDKCDCSAEQSKVVQDAPVRSLNVGSDGVSMGHLADALSAVPSAPHGS